ncbi:MULTISPECIES: hypothetical protein [unclassified Streptomyces]|uniref:hypothetical protein n=1 Tax=unclassified Streptomyces TaxID=2593676 RepID=UPI002E1B9941
MTPEPAAAADLEQLRRAELERRERLRRDREGGARAPLRARRRPTGNDSLTGQPDESGSGAPTPLPTPLPARVSHALRRALDEPGGDCAVTDRIEELAVRATDPLGAAAAEAADLLTRKDPLAALGHLVDLTVSGLPLLEQDELSRAEALRSGRVPAPEVRPDSVDSWQLHLESVEAHGRAVLSTATWQRLVATLPLSVVDDLIDEGALTSAAIGDAWPEPSDRSRYVTARLDPTG